MEQPTVENQEQTDQSTPSEITLFQKLKRHYNKVRASESFLYRFGHTLLFIQALCLLMFVTFRFLLLLDLFSAIPITALGFLLAGAILIFRLLIFTPIDVKAGAYLGSSIVYLLIALIIFAQIGPLFTSLEGVLGGSFLGVLAFWNSVFAILIFALGLFRTFIIGLAYDYRRK